MRLLFAIFDKGPVLELFHCSNASASSVELARTLILGAHSATERIRKASTNLLQLSCICRKVHLKAGMVC